MAKKLYVRNNENTEWIEVANSIQDISNYLTINSASSTYATKTELNNIDALPSQTGNSGKYLSTNGSSASWSTIDLASAINTASAAAVTYLVDSAPGALDTLNELAAALNDDENFSSTVTTELSNKLDILSASTTYAKKDNSSITGGLTLENYADINLSNSSRIWANNGGLYITSAGEISLAYAPSVNLPENTSIGNVSSTEIGYLNNVSENIQTQLNDKASLGSPIFTSTVTSPMLRLTSTIDATSDTGNWGFQIGQSTSENLRIDNNEILTLNNNVNSTLNLQRHGGQVLVGGSVVDGSSVGLEVHGPLRLESSRNAANNARGIDSMQAKIAINSTDNRQELQIYASGDSYSTGSKGSGIHLYGTDDSQHAGNIAFLTGTPDNGDARMIVAGGTGTTGYVSGGTTYTRTNTDTRVTIGNALWNWVDEKNDTGLLNLKDASSRPAIYVTSSGSVDGSTFGTIGIETGTSFGIGHWSGSSYTNRLSIDSTGIVSIPGILDVAEVRETVVSNSFSTNVMTANYNDGAIHYATVAPSANFTISLTNVPTTTSKSITMSFLITQGSTGYIPTTLNLNGSSQTIRWVGGSAPTPTSSAGKIDIFNFTLILAASNVVIASANLNI